MCKTIIFNLKIGSRKLNKKNVVSKKSEKET